MTMTTWTRDDIASATWSAGNTILYLLTEAEENLLHEDGELVLIDSTKLADWSQDTIPSNTWTQVTIT